MAKVICVIALTAMAIGVLIFGQYAEWVIADPYAPRNVVWLLVADSLIIGGLLVAITAAYKIKTL